MDPQPPVQPQPPAPSVSPSVTPPRPVPEQQPSSSPVSKKKSPILAIILVLLFLAALTTAGYFGYQYWQEVNKPTPSPILMVEPTPTPSPDPTADWKTYENKKINLSLKYPDSAKITEKTEGCINIQLEIAHINIKPPKTPSGGCVVTGLDSGYQINTTKENILLNGKVFAFSTTSASIPTKSIVFSNLENIPQEGFIIEYGGTYKPEQESDYLKEKDIIIKILSTFQFTE